MVMNMARFILKTAIAFSLFFIGLLVGIQEANNGMKKMRGYEDPGLSSAFSIEEKADGQYETTVLGSTKTHDFEEKKRKLEEMKSYNFFTDIAKRISGFLSEFFANLLPK